MEDTKRKQLALIEQVATGGTLLQELRHADVNSNAMLVAIFRQLFDALAHLHDPAAGCCCIVHRDVKPENIIFKTPASEGTAEMVHPLLIDFGMATDLDLSGSGPPETGMMGSPGALSERACVCNQRFCLCRRLRWKRICMLCTQCLMHMHLQTHAAHAA